MGINDLQRHLQYQENNLTIMYHFYWKKLIDSTNTNTGLVACIHKS